MVLDGRCFRRIWLSLMRYVVVVWIVAIPDVVLGNPISDAAARRLNDLPFLVARGQSKSDEAEFVRSLVRYGLDQPLLYRKKTLQFVDSNFTKLKPYLLEAQETALNEGIQARFRSQGSAADREAMLAILRHNLTKPPPPIPESRVYVIDGEGYSVSPSQTAEILADWGDLESLSRITSMAKDTTYSADVRSSFLRSANRLRNPCAYGFLVADGRGGIKICRQPSDLVSAKMLSPSQNVPECTQPLDSIRLASIWSHLTSSREGRHARWFDGGGTLRLEFRDGLRADIRPTDSRWFNYSDTSRGDRWSLLIQNPTLFNLLENCLPERALPQWTEK